MPVNWHIVNCRFSRKMSHLANHVAPRVLQPNDASGLPATQAPGPLRTPAAEGCPRPGKYGAPPPGALRWGSAQPLGSVRWRTAELRTSGLQLGAYNIAARHHRLELCERHGARQVFHAAVGRNDEPFWRDVAKGAPYPLGDDLRRLHPVVLEIEHAIHHALVGQHVECARIEVWLCGLERDLLHGASIQRREETVRIWLVNFDVVRIAEAQVHDGGSGNALKRPVDAIDGKFIGLGDE